ncbi:MAG TPA: response regulator [Candidatus Methanoperedens sp.]|nr:response regulator [Candidatus Methanoperedens sp.]
MTPPSFSLELGRYYLPIYALLPLAVGAISLILGAYVLVWTRASHVGLRFFLFALCIHGWLGGLGASYASLDRSQIVWWIRFSHIGLVFLPAAIAAFLLALLDLSESFRSVIRGAIAISFLLVVSVFTTDLFLADYRQFFWGVYPQYGPLGTLFVAFFASIMLMTLVVLWKGYHNTTSLRNKRRMRILLVGFGISYLASVDWAAVYGLNIYPFGYLPVLVFNASAAYLVIRYQLADITPKTAANKILEMMEGGLIVVDLDGRVRVINKAAADLLGGDESSLLGKEIASVLKLPPRLRHLQAILSAPVHEQELTLPTPEGQRREVLVSASGLTENKTVPIGIIYVLIDISEQKKTEEALAKARDEAQAANRAKSEFLANMSHEIRTPLNGIIGAAELCRETPLNEEQRTLIGSVHSEANSLYTLLNNILDISKIEAGKLEIEQIPFDLRYLLRDMTGTFAVQTSHKAIRLESCFSPDMPSWSVGDPGRLRQVFVNLLANAVKFTPAGGRITVSGRVEEELGEKVRLYFAVTDTGIGIPKERQGKIFESFTQADGSITRKYGGTGLGTTISRQLCELMGGSIGVESDGQNGSTFWFTALVTRDTTPHAPEARSVDVRNLRVLVVHDQPSPAYSPREDLVALGCDPVESTGAAEALAASEAAGPPDEPWDLVVLNLHSLTSDNLELVPRLRGCGRASSVPIVALASIGNVGDGGKCSVAGIDAYLAGPVTRMQLSKVLAQIAGRKREGAAAPIPQLITKHSLLEGSVRAGRILLVEDYPTNQQIIMKYLEQAKYEVDLAADGRLAVEAFRTRRYDLILMDIQMPVMDGFEATRAIRKLEEEARSEPAAESKAGRCVIIAMTAHALKGDRDKCLEAGMDDYLTKPMKKEQLLSVVHKWLATAAETTAALPRRDQEQATTAVSAEEPMDFEDALEALDGDRRLLIDLLVGFVERAEDQIVTIGKALAAGDAETVRCEAHSIKGAASLLLADKLARQARELERIGETGNLERGSLVFESFVSEHRRLAAFVAARGGGRSSSGSSTV